MPYWFPPQFLGGLEFQNPVEPTRRAIVEVKALGADAIVLAGHMGLKERTGGDDFANRVMALTAEFPEVAVFIAGHTHQDLPLRLTNNVLFTQADHFGIHVGRVDLVFEDASRVRRAARHLAAGGEFADALIVGRAQTEGCTALASFDKELKKRFSEFVVVPS